MKLLLTADWHLRVTAPVNRIDNYYKAQMNKLRWVLKTAEDHGAVILQAGDFFDRPVSSYSLLSVVGGIILGHGGVDVYCVYGQHDLGYHTRRSTTALNLLDRLGCVRVVNYGCHITLRPGINIHGSSWGEDILEVGAKSNRFNILLTHKMVVKGRRLWKTQVDYVTSKWMLRNTNYDLIVSGDNHKHFIDRVDDRTLVNPGSLMRITSAQLDHEPRVVIFDTSTREYEVLKVPIVKSEEVFDMDSIEEREEISEELDAFVSGLESDSEFEGLDFLKNLDVYMKVNDVEDSVKEYVRRMVNG